MSPKFSALLVLIILEKAESALRPVVTFNPNWDKIFSTESLTMTCNVRSSIPADMIYTWYKDNKWKNTEQSIVIINAKTGDSGNYRCKGTKTDISDPVRLDVSNDYVILQAPLYVHEGDNVTLKCHHYPTYSGGQTIFYKDNTVIRDWGSDPELHIYNINLAGSKGYKCTKKVPYSEYSGEASIPMKELFTTPEIKVTPFPVMEGDNVTVTCHTNVSPYRPETELQFAFHKAEQNVQKFGSSDQYGFQFAKLENSGEYYCEVSGRMIVKRSKELNIEINEPFTQSEIIMTPNQMTEGDNMTLNCHTVRSELIPDTGLEFAFYRDGQNVQEFSLFNQYEVQSAETKHSGTYSCKVTFSTNKLTRSSKELYIQIQGNTKFFIILIPLALGILLLLVAILVTLFICSKRRSSVKPQEPTTEGFNTSSDCDVQPEITYSILAMYPMPQDAPVTTKENHENNVIYAVMNPKSRRQPAPDPDCIYQNI
ncbi:high affinity immunoglobulin gamma Fc receptor I-like isoform X3 [Aquarana catesbeiana]|uniref:high affinity immunoglobulin gamma Fc receptor I-like isoform X3 n=1 Tax=Aquarana catesbeiana TaxID=8400 RepID=UPI003CC9492B